MEYLANSLEIINNPSEIDLWDQISSLIDKKSGILGYKTPSLGEKDFDNIPSFIIRGPEFGIILIDVIDEKIIEFDEDNEFWKTESGEDMYSKDLTLNAFFLEIEGRLKKSKELFDVRTNKWIIDLPIKSYLVFRHNTAEQISVALKSVPPLISKYITSTSLEQELQSLLTLDINIDPAKIDIVDSVLDGSDVFKKGKKKKAIVKLETINDFIKKSLSNTFKLDHIQRQIALQIPPGPQRIRGLAGTGKTVILCMKAALAHKTSNNMKILFVFNTQSMYNQVKNAIAEYYFNEAKSMPNWDNLHVLHAWGGAAKEGVYHKTAISCGIKPLNFMNVKGKENPLDIIYSDLLAQAKSKIIPEYDIVLIDEAQDFPPSFFETIYCLTKPDQVDPTVKKIIWAYDEFQSLTEIKIKEPEDLFGKNSNGEPNMPNTILNGKYKGDIEKDFILPNSYRNPRINLLVAHGLALGVYSKHGKIPMESKRDWEARGYKIHAPDKLVFTEGDKIKAERLEEFSKNNLEKLLKENGKDEKQMIKFKSFTNANDELNTVVGNIKSLVNDQKVEPEEIVVINLDTQNSKSQFLYIRQQLDTLGIKSIMPGYIESTDAFKEVGFVTLSTTFRSKGNEANIVFIINSQRVISDATFRMRNAVFVAITRSRGWCYIFGHGAAIDDLKEEIDKIVSDYPFFNFTFPSEDQIKRRLTILNSNKDIEKVDQDIDKMLAQENLRALLVEKLLKDPEILKAMEQRKKEDDDTE